ncbi:putative pectinesterase/pectinesterase inhibitor 51 [Glycine soja]
MSASLGYQYGCWNSLKYINHTSLVAKTVSSLDSLTILSNNGLSMMVSYDLLENNIVLWMLSAMGHDDF